MLVHAQRIFRPATPERLCRDDIGHGVYRPGWHVSRTQSGGICIEEFEAKRARRVCRKGLHRPESNSLPRAFRPWCRLATSSRDSPGCPRAKRLAGRNPMFQPQQESRGDAVRTSQLPHFDHILLVLWLSGRSRRHSITSPSELKRLVFVVAFDVKAQKSVAILIAAHTLTRCRLTSVRSFQLYHQPWIRFLRFGLISRQEARRGSGESWHHPAPVLRPGDIAMPAACHLAIAPR